MTDCLKDIKYGIRYNCRGSRYRSDGPLKGILRALLIHLLSLLFRSSMIADGLETSSYASESSIPKQNSSGADRDLFTLALNENVVKNLEDHISSFQKLELGLFDNFNLSKHPSDPNESFEGWMKRKLRPRKLRHPRSRQQRHRKTSRGQYTYVVVNSTTGLIRGRRSNAPAPNQADSFLGIPYAVPPIGALRFKAPIPVKPWPGVLDATHPPNSCIQIVDTVFGDFPGSVMWNANTHLSEDCLTLNVWTPFPRFQQGLKSEPPLPVIIWIYGGGYYSGTITLPLYDGAVLASKMRVVVMSMNYRMGSLGFLYFGTSDAPGNQGLWDQLMAIRWMRTNAAIFGGDPHRFTLMGESAGASSVAFHLLSQASADFFEYGILQSASATSPWALVRPKAAIHNALLLADSLKCPDQSLDHLDDIMTCLRAVNHTTLLEREFITTHVMEFPFVPVIDGNFLAAHPRRLLDLGLYKRVPLLLGSNLNEGTSFSVYYLEKLFQPLSDDLSHVRREDLLTAVQDIYWHLHPLAHEAVIFHYTNWEHLRDSNQIVASIDAMAGDLWFTCNVNEFASYYAFAGIDVYMYQFAHRSPQNPWPAWMGVMHGDEIPFVFGEPLRKAVSGEPATATTPSSTYSWAEKELSFRMMRYWTNFARTGNPNGDAEMMFNDIKWPLYTAFEKLYLKLETNMTYNTSMTHRGPRMRSCAFQKIYLPQLASYSDEMKHKVSCALNGALQTMHPYSLLKSLFCTFFITNFIYSLFLSV